MKKTRATMLVMCSMHMTRTLYTKYLECIADMNNSGRWNNHTGSKCDFETMVKPWLREQVFKLGTGVKDDDRAGGSLVVYFNSELEF